MVKEELVRLSASFFVLSIEKTDEKV